MKSRKPSLNIRDPSSKVIICAKSQCFAQGTRTLFYISEIRNKIYTYTFCNSCATSKLLTDREWVRRNYYESLIEARVELISRKLTS